MIDAGPDQRRLSNRTLSALIDLRSKRGLAAWMGTPILGNDPQIAYDLRLYLDRLLYDSGHERTALLELAGDLTVDPFTIKLACATGTDMLAALAIATEHACIVNDTQGQYPNRQMTIQAHVHDNSTRIEVPIGRFGIWCGTCITMTHDVPSTVAAGAIGRTLAELGRHPILDRYPLRIINAWSDFSGTTFETDHVERRIAVKNLPAAALQRSGLLDQTSAK